MNDFEDAMVKILLGPEEIGAALGLWLKQAMPSLGDVDCKFSVDVEEGSGVPRAVIGIWRHK